MLCGSLLCIGCVRVPSHVFYTQHQSTRPHTHTHTLCKFCFAAKHKYLSMAYPDSYLQRTPLSETEYAPQALRRPSVCFHRGHGHPLSYYITHPILSFSWFSCLKSYTRGGFTVLLACIFNFRMRLWKQTCIFTSWWHLSTELHRITLNMKRSVTTETYGGVYILISCSHLHICSPTKPRPWVIWPSLLPHVPVSLWRTANA